MVEKILQVDSKAANLIIAAALLIGTPFFIVFGALSDRIGRKRIVLAGCALAVVSYSAVFKGLTHFANPALERAVATARVTVIAAEGDCTFQFDPVGKKAFTQSCDVAKSSLAKSGVPYRNEVAEPGSVARVRIGEGSTAVFVASFAGETLSSEDFKAANKGFTTPIEVIAADHQNKPDVGSQIARKWYVRDRKNSCHRERSKRAQPLFDAVERRQARERRHANSRSAVKKRPGEQPPPGH